MMVTSGALAEAIAAIAAAKAAIAAADAGANESSSSDSIKTIATADASAKAADAPDAATAVEASRASSSSSPTAKANKSVFAQWEQMSTKNNNDIVAPLSPLSEGMKQNLTDSTAAVKAPVKRWTPPGKKGSGALSGEQTAAVAPPVKRWTPPPDYMIGGVLADHEQKQKQIAAAIAPVKRWTPPNKRGGGVLADQEQAAAIAPVKRWTPPDKRSGGALADQEQTAAIAPVKRWTPPDKRVGGALADQEQTAAKEQTATVAPVKRWTPPDKRSGDALADQEQTAAIAPVKRWTPPDKRSGGALADQEQTAAKEQTAAIAPVKRWTPPDKKSNGVTAGEQTATVAPVKRWTPPDKTNAPTMTVQGELAEVLRRRSTAAATDAMKEGRVYTGKRWSTPDKKTDQAAEEKKEEQFPIPAAVYTGKRWSPPGKDETPDAIIASGSGTENSDKGGFSSPMFKIISSSTPPTSPESDIGSGSSSSSNSDPSPRQLTYQDENPEPPSPLPQAATVAADKSIWRRFPNPIRKWLTSSVNPTSTTKTNDIMERNLVLQQTTVSGNVAVLASSTEVVTDHTEDGVQASSSMKDDEEEYNAVSASLKEKEAKGQADSGETAPSSTAKDEKEGLQANSDDTLMRFEEKSEDALSLYFQKNLSWQRKRQQKQIKVASSGVYRSGNSKLLRQPEDNEHGYAVVLSEKEMKKKKEEEEELEKKRQYEEEELEKKRQYEEEEEKKIHQVVRGTLLEFHALVIKLVREVMPTEVNHVDALIEEYEGREAELLDILKSMRENENQEDDDNDEINNSICSGTTLRISNMDSNDACNNQDLADEESGPIIFNGDGIMRSTDVDDQGHKWRRLRRKRTGIVIAIGLLLFICGAISLRIVLDDKYNSQSNKDDASFLPREDGDLEIANEDIIYATQVPAVSPPVFEVVTDVQIPLAACNTFLEEEHIQKLGIRNLQGSYPKIAIDGDQAIVASGSGYIAFFSLDPETKTWTRTEVFGLMVTVGEVRSVAISGNTAVVGAPKASLIDLDAEGGLVQTGAIFIYERDPMTTTWRQLKGSYIPIEYRYASAMIMMDQYADAQFGSSVDIDGDVIVVGAPDEANNRGSLTVFAKDEKTMDWVQIERVQPDNLCEDEFYGHSVQVSANLIAVSADCDISIVLYQIDRPEVAGGEEVIQVSRFQELEHVDAGYGAISSISMSGNQLAYSTVSGGLFYYSREDQEFFLSQELSFEFISNPDPLFAYPLRMDASTNMMILSVANEVYVYTRDLTSQEWNRESFVLKSEGDYAGYMAASVALSGGRVLVAQAEEIHAYDFTGCVRESSAPSYDPNTAAMLEAFSALSPMTATSTISASTPTSLPTQNPTVKPDCHVLDVIVNLDAHPSYIRWEIVSVYQGLSTTVAISRPYDASFEYTTDTQSFCLTVGTYQFTIYDDYGDGASTEWFDVYYQLEFNNEVIASGESFGLSETIEFNMPDSEEIIRG